MAAALGGRLEGARLSWKCALDQNHLWLAPGEAGSTPLQRSEMDHPKDLGQGAIKVGFARILRVRESHNSPPPGDQQ